MIQKLRRKFILISTLALAVVLTTVIGSIIGTTYYRASQEVNEVLTILAKNHGDIPGTGTTKKSSSSTSKKVILPKSKRESYFQYRYFAVTFNSKGKITKVNDNHISTVSLTEVKRLAKQYRSRRASGHTYYNGSTYAYKRVTKDKQTTIVFLDESILTARSNQIFKSAVILGLASLALYTFLLALFSKRAIEPVIIAEKRQKEFITNAGHELKTPLAIISANNEMMEILNGENEWTQSNHQQVTRLTQLINRLVSLARLDERPEMVITTVDASHQINEVANSFRPVIEQDGKQFDVSVAPDLKVKADEGYFTELINIFVDNANKYCDDGGTVRLQWQANKNFGVLTIANSYAEGKDVDYQKFFDRFYRNDTSHNQKKKGFGIGLSMAQNLIQTFKGKLSVDYQEGMIFFRVKFKLEK